MSYRIRIDDIAIECDTAIEVFALIETSEISHAYWDELRSLRRRLELSEASLAEMSVERDRALAELEGAK